MNLSKKEKLARMQRAFYPRNVAVVGAARHNNFMWIRNHLPFHQNHGKVFHVNIDKNEWPGAEALGVQCFASLLDIPEPVDYVSISVPRQIVPRILEDCIKKDVATVHVYAAGFGESGEPEGIRLDGVISEMARKSGLLVIGPNCMGLFNPSVGIRQGSNQYHGESGIVAYISQSGSQATGFSLEADAHGVKISKSISMGNGLVLDVPDYLDYLAEDEETKAIGMFLEGTRDLRRFFRSLEEACKKKPVVVWKVGQTEDAARATAAHTGTAYIREELWISLVDRCGALQVESVEEMVETIKGVSLLPPVVGFNLGLMATTGGHSTEMASVFSKFGFKIPRLSEGSYQELGSFFNLQGSNYVNPVQTMRLTRENYDRTLNILMGDENVDLVVVEMSAGPLAQSEEVLEQRVKAIKDAKGSSLKPAIVILASSFPRVDSSILDSIGRRFAREGIPAFYSFQRGAQALKRVVAYHFARSYLAK
ncbi:MAG: CoA-binding protein [Chloroflexi bacterium]|nr:CoA-binding protein [Chloroflexota bacterium]